MTTRLTLRHPDGPEYFHIFFGPEQAFDCVFGYGGPYPETGHRFASVDEIPDPVRLSVLHLIAAQCKQMPQPPLAL